MRQGVTVKGQLLNLFSLSFFQLLYRFGNLHKQLIQREGNVLETKSPKSPVQGRLCWRALPMWAWSCPPLPSPTTAGKFRQQEGCLRRP